MPNTSGKIQCYGWPSCQDHSVRSMPYTFRAPAHWISSCYCQILRWSSPLSSGDTRNGPGSRLPLRLVAVKKSFASEGFLPPWDDYLMWLGSSSSTSVPECKYNILLHLAHCPRSRGPEIHHLYFSVSLLSWHILSRDGLSRNALGQEKLDQL